MKWNEYEENDEIKDYPVLLEPSYYKYDDQVFKHLKVQWDSFLNNLLEADTILIIGYSLPGGDSEARSMISIAFQENQKAKWAVVDPRDNICKKYERLFGAVRLTTFEKDLTNFNTDLDNNLEVAFPNV